MSALVDSDPSFRTAAPRPQKPRTGALFRDRLVIPLLVLLTLIAGVLRFTALDRPTIWGDEAATYGRVAGSYQELLDQLVNAMFTPLHYELTWWIGQGMPYRGMIDERVRYAWRYQIDRTRTPVEGRWTLERIVESRTFTPTHRLVDGGIRLTPKVLRFVPALCGVLMVPAIYFLARQLFGPRVSLLAAGFACFSAYLLVYSRDAKMYSDFWLMCVLHVGCLLWWLRVRTALAWLCWVATGLAMMGLHALGGAVLAVCTVIFITSPRQNLLGLLKLPLLAAWIAGIPFVLLYRWLQVRYGLIEWLTPHRYDRWGAIQWHRFRWPPVIFFAIGMCVIIRGPLMYYGSFNERMGEAVGDDGTLSVNETGINWVQRYNDGRSLDDLVLYTTSAYLTGWEWPRSKENNGVDDQSRVNPRTLKLLKASTVGLLALLAIGALPWRRVLQPARARLERITQDGRAFGPYVARRVFWIGFWVVVPAYGFYTQSYQWITTPLDAVSSFVLKEQPTPAIRWPRLAKPPANEQAVSVWTESAFIEIGPKHREWFGQFADHYAEALAKYRQQFRPEDGTSIWSRFAYGRLTVLAAALIIVLLMLVWRWRILWRTTLRLAVAVVVIVLVCQALTIVPRFPDQSVWMPRYVGVVLPAVVLAAAALVYRQPTWWLRTATIGLFVMVNLAQFSARTFGQSEPPVDLMAADVVRAYKGEGSFRTFLMLSPRHSSAEPGGGSLHNSPGSYYLRELSGIDAPAQEVRLGRLSRRLRVEFRDNPNVIAAEANMIRPPLETLVVWSSLPAGEVDLSDPLAEKLKGQFKRVNEEIWTVRDHWTWMDRWQFRRRTYQRIAPPPPPAPPVSQPAAPPPPKPAEAKPTPPAPPESTPPQAKQPDVKPETKPPAPPAPATRPAAPPATRPAPTTRPAAPAPSTRPATQPVNQPPSRPPTTRPAATQPATTQPTTRPTTQPASR